MINPFEPLGISPTLSEDEVRRAYHEKARRVHPDQFPDGPEQDAATRKMILLNQAYEEAMALVKSRSVSPYLLTLPCEDAVELANRLLKQNSPDRALRQLMRAENRDASWYDAQGRVMMALEQYRTAEESFRRALLDLLLIIERIERFGRRDQKIAEVRKAVEPLGNCLERFCAERKQNGAVIPREQLRKAVGIRSIRAAAGNPMRLRGVF